MRRVVGAIVAVAALIGVSLGLGGAVAGAQVSPRPGVQADLNQYQVTISTTSKRPGTAKAPAPLGVSLRLLISPNQDVNTDPLTGVDLTLGGVRLAAVGYPICSLATISHAGDDVGCPAGALVATGTIGGTVWSPAQPSAAGVNCEADLNVWNAGGGALTYFLRVLAGHYCAGLQTGEIPPWSAKMRQTGTSVTIDAPLPAAVSTDIGDTGLFSGLTSMVLHFRPLSQLVGTRVVPLFGSTGCAGQRPYTLTVTAQGTAATQTSQTRATANC